MKRILVSVSNDINNDQRLHRTSLTLLENNFDVLVVGREKKDSKPISLPYKTKRFKLLFSKGFLFYASFNLRLFFFLLLSKKDALFANDLDTLLPNYLVSKLQNKPLIFDSHELFSEVPELESRPVSKKVWKFLEDQLIPKLTNIITVSEGVKTYYQNNYGVNVTVVRNVPLINNLENNTRKENKILLYQGSVNVGRGIELMIETIPFLEDYKLWIVGDGDILEQLEQKVLHLELENKVKFFGKISPKKLKEITPQATIGFSLEEDLGLNYRYALPNKLFDYIQAEIPVIVSNLPDMSGLVKEYKIGKVLKERTPNSLTETIRKIESKNYTKNLVEAKKQLNWSKEKIQLENVLKAVV